MDPRALSKVTYLARTNARHPHRVFGIKEADRLSHVYVIGKTGTGKSTFLETMIRQDVEHGQGLALLDPHGDLVERVAAAVPAHRLDDLVYLNAPDPAQPYGYNPLRRVRADKRSLAASGMLEVLRKMWTDAWGVRMEHILRNGLLALLEQKAATLPDLLRLLGDDPFRKSVAALVRNPPVREFWLREYPKYPYRYRAEAIAPIQNKIGAYLADPKIRKILTAPEKPIHIRGIMDECKILLINVAKGKIGDDAASLLGGLLVTTMGLAAFSRAEIPEEERRPFYVYVDEFQNFTTLSVATMVAELRKYRVAMTFAHQYLHQLDREVQHAVLGNAGTIIAFRLGPSDVSLLAREFAPQIGAVDLLNLPNHSIYLKLMIDGMPSSPFSADTLRPDEVPACCTERRVEQGSRPLTDVD